uniref:Uncharacterized protein n=1 Tax=Timema poppense TaxID=170557 RepID=A0A7R9HCY9_TIMPO|nr:unnamed protein product [Timema poppensis]
MVSVLDHETEVKEVLENFTNLEKECESTRQPVSVELQEKIKKLREDWHYVKNRGEPISQQASSLPANKATVVTTSPLVQKAPSRSPANAKPRVSTDLQQSNEILLEHDTTGSIVLQGGLRLEISHGAQCLFRYPL